MLIAIVHNALPPNAREDERDVLVQAEAVAQALHELGHSCELVPVGLDLGPVLERLRQLQPELLFNLVESFAGSDRLASLPVAALEQLGLPLTGSSAEVLWLSNSKTLSKQRMATFRLPTPAWCELVHGEGMMSGGAVEFDREGGIAFILKPIFEHASLGMDESAIVRPASVADLARRLDERSRQLGCPCFAEEYIDGREFNISLLTKTGDCEVLPLAETDFSDFPPGTARIVDYRAKWDESSFAYHHTPRKFLPPAAEPMLAGEIARLARACWHAFGLDGYVRVDFRVDRSGQPWILEINTNPCLAPDAGFAASLHQARIPFAKAIERILAAAQVATKKGTGLISVATKKGTGLISVVASADVDRLKGPVSLAGPSATDEISWRYEVSASDPAAVRDLVAATGFFYPEEVAVAEELVTERLARGDASEYFFVLAERDHHVVGYACFGPIACTRNSYDLYWIAVHPDAQGIGLGKRILRKAEDAIYQRGGRRVYIETSNRPQYASTRGFYLRCDYRVEATLQEFYGPGDDKVIYVKALDP